MSFNIGNRVLVIKPGSPSWGNEGIIIGDQNANGYWLVNMNPDGKDDYDPYFHRRYTTDHLTLAPRKAEQDWLWTATPLKDDSKEYNTTEVVKSSYVVVFGNGEEQEYESLNDATLVASGAVRVGGKAEIDEVTETITRSRRRIDSL